MTPSKYESNTKNNLFGLNKININKGIDGIAGKYYKYVKQFCKA